MEQRKYSNSARYSIWSSNHITPWFLPNFIILLTLPQHATHLENPHYVAPQENSVQITLRFIKILHWFFFGMNANQFSSFEFLGGCSNLVLKWSCSCLFQDLDGTSHFYLPYHQIPYVYCRSRHGERIKAQFRFSQEGRKVKTSYTLSSNEMRRD